MLLLLLLSLGAAPTATAAENLYRITFTNKGNVDFSEASSLYHATLSKFRPEALARRAAARKHPLLDTLDQPIAQKYIDSLSERGIRPLLFLNWTNAIIAELDSAHYAALVGRSFVHSIQAVSKRSYGVQADGQPCEVTHPGMSAVMHNLINTTPLHNAGVFGENVRYGLIDCGFRWQAMSSLRHIRVADTYDFIQGDSIVSYQPGERSDQDGHGSVVLSVAAGWLQDTLIGMAPSATFLLAKTENLAYERRIEEEAYCAAIEWLERQGAMVISSSVGYYNFDSTEDASVRDVMTGNTTFASRAINRAVGLGVVVATAAGNGGLNPNSIIIPAEADSVIAVGGATDQRAHWINSSFGLTTQGVVKPDLACLGVNVVSQDPDGQVKAVAGTSLATPQIGGAISLLCQLFPNVEAFHLRNGLYSSCTVDDSVGSLLGRGIPNVTVAARNIGDRVPPGIGPTAVVNWLGMRTLLTTIYSHRLQNVSLLIADGNRTHVIPGAAIDSLWYSFPLPDSLFITDTIRGWLVARNDHGERRYPSDSSTFPIVRSQTHIACGMRLPDQVLDIKDVPTQTMVHECSASPNPIASGSTLYIQSTYEPHTIHIVSTSTGSLVAALTPSPSANGWMVQLPFLASGHYLVVVSGKQQVLTTPLIILN